MADKKKFASLATLQIFLDNLKNLFATKTEVDEKANVQIVTNNESGESTENIQTLKIHKMTQEQYDELLDNNGIEENALYLTPYEEIDFSQYATVSQLNAKANANHNHNTLYDAKGSASTALDTAKELIDALQDELDAHTHEIADIDGLTTTLANKAEKNHGTHVVYLVASPLMDGTASAGSKNEVARADHRHPTDTSRAAKTDLDSHTGNTTVHITATERTDWNAAKTNAAAAQTRADSAYTLAESKADSLSDLGVTATAAELNYMDGVTSNVQTQLDGKSASGHTHTHASLGQGTGYCSTSSSTAAKVVSLLNYNLVEGGVVSVEFVYSVPASATMNINSKGAKSIYYRGKAITENIIKGGDRATFIYYSSRYHLISVDRWHEDIVDLQATDGKVEQKAVVANANYPLLLAQSYQTEDTTGFTYFDSGVYLNPSTNKIYANISGTATGLQGLTATVSELNYVGGVTSNIQTQLDAKATKVAGLVHQYAGANAPDGYLLCDGSFYRTDEYPELFDAIGFTYGESGSGVNLMFAVPNLATRVPVGVGSGYALGSTGGEAKHTLTVNEIPAHDHGATYSGNADSGNKKYDWFTNTGTKIGYQAISTGSGAAHNNMQPYIVLNYIISTGK